MDATIALVSYWAQLILGLYGVWIAWRDSRWWLALLVFIIPFAGIIVALFWLIGGISIPQKIVGAPPASTVASLMIPLLAVTLITGGCGLFSGWSTFNGSGFSVSLPGKPTTNTATANIPGVGTPTVNNYTLDVADPRCSVRILTFDSWPATFDMPGLAYTILLPVFLGNQGNRPAVEISGKNGFAGQEYSTQDGKAILRLYLAKPAIRGVLITSQTNTLDKDFVKKVFDSFSPSQLQAK